MTAEYRFTIRAEKPLADALRQFCKTEELKPSQVLRKALRDYLAKKKSLK